MEKIDDLSFSRAAIVGRGRFSTVMKGELEGKSVAVKRYRDVVTQINSEIMMKANGHINIIQYHCVKRNDVEYLYLVNELCAGTLDDYVRGKYKGEKIWSDYEILRQITDGVDHLHNPDLKIVHGDLKPSNIMISFRFGNMEPLFKLADFGLRHIVTEGGNDSSILGNDQNKLFRPAHTKGWFSPFDLENNVLFDIFSLGCLFVFILKLGLHPFGSNTELRVDRISKCLPMTPTCEQALRSIPGAYELISRMLSFKMNERPSAFCIFANPLLRAPIASKADPTPSTSSSTPKLHSGQSLPKKLRMEPQLSHEDGSADNLHSRVPRVVDIFPLSSTALNDSIQVDESDLDNSSMPTLSPIITEPGSPFSHRSSSSCSVQIIDQPPTSDSRMASYPTGARPKLVPNKCVAKKSTSKQCLQSYQAAKTSEYFQALSDSETDSSESEDEIMIVDDATKSGPLVPRVKIPVSSASYNNMRSNSSLRMTVEDTTTTGPLVPRVEIPVSSAPSNNMISPPSRSSLRMKSRTQAKSVSFQLNPDSTHKNRATRGDRSKIGAPLLKEEELMNLCNCTQRLDDKQFARFCQLVADKTLDINYYDSSKLTPLLRLCLMQESDQLYDCVKELLERPDLDVNKRDSGTCWNALAMACRHHQSNNLLKIVLLLLEKDIDVHVTDEFGDNAIMVLCANYKHDDLIHIVRLLVERGIDLNLTKEKLGWNAMVYLCYNYSGANLVDIVSLLIERGSQVNLEWNRNDNALTAACASYNHESLINVVRLLLQHEIDVNWVNPVLQCNALLTLSYSRFNGNNLINIVSELLDAGIERNAADCYGWNCLLVLAKKHRKHRDFVNIMRLLFKKGISINHQSVYDHLAITAGSNVAHLLCRLGEENKLLTFVRFLKGETDLNWKIKDKNGNTPLDLLKKRKFKDNNVKIAIFKEFATE